MQSWYYRSPRARQEAGMGDQSNKILESSQSLGFYFDDNYKSLTDREGESP
ncbi:unnamed protein product [Staurois parvus]|uniref:Uncharacterized protein n=1 Tax=Staurois parvus TaxID=386267 RepID=A0ABN9G6D8_9NEOB|nr:unnamed protein product [Staurois parvus]